MIRITRRTTTFSIILLFTVAGLAACSSDQKAPEAETASPAPPASAPSPPPGLLLDEVRKNSALAGVITSSRAGYFNRPQIIGPITERYAHFENNGIRRTNTDPISTFSIDVDTGAYANVRRFLKDGSLPPADAVRIEEMINYFRYQYDAPSTIEQPFSVNWDLAHTPWNQHTYLLRIGLKGFEPPAGEARPPANLVFLLDVSGSMMPANKLPLMVKAMRLLTDQLGDQDRVAIVVYAGSSGLVLESTSGKDKAAIHTALERLHAGGSTAGGEGIELAYRIAKSSYIEGGINRVILATDGDFNVGVVDTNALKDIIARKRKDGISLTTLGLGTGNYNDSMLEQLADVGDGNYAYIDSLMEARKVLVEQVSGTLLTIAKDVKIQIEFNPAVVSEYRLIGYENRILETEDFDNDKVDAGEIGSGHTVTALYEIALKGSLGEKLPKLRYQETAATEDTRAGEFGHVKLRYKTPGGDVSKLIEFNLPAAALAEVAAEPSGDMSLALAVAAFGQHLRASPHLGDFGIDDMIALAEHGQTGPDTYYRAEFIELLKLAKLVG